MSMIESEDEKMKVLVIMTGGAISRTVSGDCTLPADLNEHELITRYISKHTDSDVTFDVMSPYNIRSQDLSYEHLNILIRTVREKKTEGYGGIIIAQGAATLQYTASALGFVFGTSCLPIVVTAANSHLGNRQTNGHRNFEAAVAFVRSQSGKGVFVSYRNPDGVTRIHRATRLLAHPENSDTVLSVGKSPYAMCEDGVIIKNTAYRRGDSGEAYEDAEFVETSGVLTILSKPGGFFAYDLDVAKAILLRPYHAGMLNTKNPTFIDFCRRAHEKGIPLFVTGMGDDVDIEQDENLADLGIAVLPTCAFVPIYMKLWLAVSLGEDIRSFMETPLAEEYMW